MEQLKDFFSNRKNLTNFLITIIVLLAIPIAGKAISDKNSVLNFFTKAAGQITIGGAGVTTRNINGQSVQITRSAAVSVTLSSPYGPQTSGSSVGQANFSPSLASNDLNIISRVHAQCDPDTENCSGSGDNGNSGGSLGGQSCVDYAPCNDGSGGTIWYTGTTRDDGSCDDSNQDSHECTGPSLGSGAQDYCNDTGFCTSANDGGHYCNNGGDVNAGCSLNSPAQSDCWTTLNPDGTCPVPPNPPGGFTCWTSLDVNGNCPPPPDSATVSPCDSNGYCIDSITGNEYCLNGSLNYPSCSQSSQTGGQTGGTGWVCGKVCGYTQDDQLLSGNCSDNSQNCSDDINCSYVSGCSTGQPISGTIPGAGNPSNNSSTTCPYDQNCDPGTGNVSDGQQSCTGRRSNPSSACLYDPSTNPNCSACQKISKTGQQKTGTCNDGEPTGACSDANGNTGHFYCKGTTPSKTCTIEACANGGTPPTCKATKSPTPSPTLNGTIKYKLAETQAGLSSAPEQDYNSGSSSTIVVSHTFSDTTPGTKFIFAQFKNNQGQWSDPQSASILLIGPDPSITGTDCEPDVSGNGVNFTIQGTNFGTANGTISANGTAVSNITAWADTQITAVNPSVTSNANGTVFNLTVTRPDGSAATGSCTVGVSTLKATNLYACTRPGAAAKAISNVQIIAYDTTSKKEQKDTVSIDAQGNIQGLKAALSPNKAYKVGIKTPQSLLRVFDVTPSTGTTLLNQPVPFGDLVSDGIINSADVSSMYTQWSLKPNTSATLTGDANGDGVVNSLDYACLVKNFGGRSDPDPATGP